MGEGGVEWTWRRCTGQVVGQKNLLYKVKVLSKLPTIPQQMNLEMIAANDE